MDSNQNVVKTAVPWGRYGRYLYKLTLFLISLFLFVTAILLLKEGAATLAPYVENAVGNNNPIKSLGAGWLAAYLLMSGSPVATAALAFFDAGALDPLSTYMMISGSRFGGSFIVLLIGFLYVIRGRSTLAALDMGILSLIVTASTYLTSLFIGILLLQSSWLDRLKIPGDLLLIGIVDLVFTPLLQQLTTHLPTWSLFPIGLVIIVLSFHLFDRCLPQLSLRDSHVGQVSHLVYRPWVMFLLGALLTTISMSVSISLSILVPLSNRGFIRRENVIPYIMGANVTTFIDTLLAAALLGNPAAVSIVAAQMISVTFVSAILLTIGYRPYEKGMLNLLSWATQDMTHLGVATLVLLTLPLLLLIF